MTNRLGATCWTVVCCMAWVISCSGKDNHGGFLVPNDDGGAGGSVSHPRAGAGGGSSSAGTGGRGGAGGSGGMVDSALAPAIKITAPKAAADPNADEVLTEDQVTVVCQVVRSTASGAAAVDASTVKIAMLDADGKEVKSASGTPTENDNEYSAAFVTVPVASGPVTFQCTASDTAKHTASTSIDSLIDHGPEIDIIEPEKASAHN